MISAICLVCSGSVVSLGGVTAKIKNSPIRSAMRCCSSTRGTVANRRPAAHGTSKVRDPTFGYWEVADDAADLHEHDHLREEVWIVVDYPVVPTAGMSSLRGSATIPNDQDAPALEVASFDVLDRADRCGACK